MSEHPNVKVIPMKDFAILPPGPGKCPICAHEHAPEFPHNKNSLYYQYKFYQEHERWPTWADATAHCTEEMKETFVNMYAERGVDIRSECYPNEKP